MKTKFSLNATQLKFIALFFMTLEHTFYVFSDFVPNYMGVTTKILGRMVAPIFIFLAVESFYHTSSRPKYLVRLIIAATIMAAGSFLLSHILSVAIELNIFASIACGVAFIWAIDTGLVAKNFLKKFFAIFISFLLFIVALFLEGSYFIPLTFLLFYFFRKQKNALLFGYALLSLSFLIPPNHYGIGHVLIFPYQWGMILGLPLIAAYNGEKGRGYKNLFYFYYPLHAWLLFTLRFLIG